MTNDEIYHYGILGQKWGVRRYQNENGTLTNAGKERYRSEKSTYGSFLTNLVVDVWKNHDKSSYDHSDSDKSELINWAVDTAINYSIIGDRRKLVDNAIRLGESVVANTNMLSFRAEQLNDETDAHTGLKLKDKNLSREEDLERVNPNFRNFDANTKNNCMLCSLTYNLRRSGYDVTANTASWGYMAEDINRWFDVKQHENISQGPPYTYEGLDNVINNTMDALLSQGEGARGAILVYWQVGGGHAMAYEIIDGEVVILDGQTNTIYNPPEEILQYVMPDIQYYRLDNAEIKPEFIKEVCS